MYQIGSRVKSFVSSLPEEQQIILQRLIKKCQIYAERRAAEDTSFVLQPADAASVSVEHQETVRQR